MNLVIDEKVRKSLPTMMNRKVISGALFSRGPESRSNYYSPISKQASRSMSLSQSFPAVTCQ